MNHAKSIIANIRAVRNSKNKSLKLMIDNGEVFIDDVKLAPVEGRFPARKRIPAGHWDGDHRSTCGFIRLLGRAWDDLTVRCGGLPTRLPVLRGTGFGQLDGC
jgi:hypothetical protein